MKIRLRRIRVLLMGALFGLLFWVSGPAELFGMTFSISGDSNKPLFGILQQTTTHLQTNWDAGVRVALIGLSWNQFYTSEGILNTAYINTQKADLQRFRDIGFKIMIDFGTQYPPSWIYNYPNSRFVNQYGDPYTTTASGDLGVNAVFNNVMREKISDYVHDVFTELGTDFDMVRLGWMRYGEIGYPGQSINGHSNSYWAFDPYAQGQLQGLPDGIPVCPVPGWIPGTASANHTNAIQFAEWYLNALLNYQSWQVNLVRQYTEEAELNILYPSWGLREGQLTNAENVDLAGTTSPEQNGELQRGFDFKRLIMNITDPKAIVYCTWIDANPAWASGDDQEVPTTSNNFTPVHYMAYYAKKNPLKLKVMGENTGGGGLSAMELTFSQMKKYGLEGLMWAFEPDLYDGVAPVLSDYKNFIEDFIGSN